MGQLDPAEHSCALYSGPEERDRLLVLVMQEERRRGDRCVCLVDDVEPTRTPYPAPGGPAPDGSVRRVEPSYARMISFLVAGAASAADDGSYRLRDAVETARARLHGGVRGVAASESAVAQVLAGLPALVLCMYDLQRFDVGTLVHVLKTHSRVLLDGTVLQGRPPVAGDHPGPTPGPDTVRSHPLARLGVERVEGSDDWLSLTGAEVRVAELVATGMTNRATAEELSVSPHTVDAHLKHMYVKLGIHSRVELTVLALRHGPPAA